MKRKSGTSSACAGLTLVEVLAGMALLGTFLAAALVAGARLTAQRGDAERRLEALRVADELLEGWWRDVDNFPRHGEGRVSGRVTWHWTTRPVESEAARAIGCDVVALELRQATAAGAGSTDGEPAVRVELVLPAEEEAEEAGEADDAERQDDAAGADAR
jgi:prepilin-type N-terminal cleavage/methylation domain-containing protein